MRAVLFRFVTVVVTPHDFQSHDTIVFICANCNKHVVKLLSVE